MTYIQGLKRTCRLILPEKRWTKNAMARTASGQRCAEDSPKAVKWCAVAALWVACQDESVIRTKLQVLLDEECRKSYGGEYNIVQVNNAVGHAAVLRVFRATIQELEGKP